MKKRLLALALTFVMLTGAIPAFGVSAAEAETEEKVLIDWNCNTLTETYISLNSNKYPRCYFADSGTDGVEKGTVRMAGDADTTSYATMILKPEMTTAAFTLEMDMKIDGLVTPTASPMYRGFIMELQLPENKLVYIALGEMGEPDENGNNATIRVTKRDRADTENAHAERIAVPTDGKFHTWTFQYDGESMLCLALDGEVIQYFPEVDGFHNKGDARFYFKNVMLNLADGSMRNDVIIDSIKLTEGTTLNYTKFEEVTVAADADAADFTVHAVLNQLAEEGELSVTVWPRGEEDKAVSAATVPEKTDAAVTVSDLPFMGVCTVRVAYTDAQPFTFNTYIPRSFETVEAGAEIKADADGKTYTFTDMKEALPEESAWYTVDYETAAWSGSALCTLAVSTASEAEIPVSLKGKYAVYVGYASGSDAVAVNGTEVSLPDDAADGIREAFALAAEFDGECVTLGSVPYAAARIAWVRFVSLTDELYDIATREDDSHTLITDNDGYSNLTREGYDNYDTLFYNDFLSRTEAIDQRQFIFCTLSTSILNYDSEAFRKHTEKRLKELSIPEEKWPADFLDWVNEKGEHLNFDDVMREADHRAFANIRKLNETGYPHEILADMTAEKIEDSQFYVSLRMSHFHTGFSYLSGTLYHLNPQWQQKGSGRASYMHEEYRAYLHDVLVEMAQPEHVTGVLMDFGRYPYTFGEEFTDVEKRSEIMYDFVKSVRADLPKGKKLTVRVIDPTCEMAEVWGLDYKRWVEEGLVDRVYISAEGHETFFDFEPYIEYFNEHPEVEFYLGINATLTGHDTTKEEEAIRNAGGKIQGKTHVGETDLMLRVYDFYNAGADGVLTFNWSGKAETYRNLNNATLMKRWYHFLYPTEIRAAQPARFTDAGGKRVIFDYDCASLSLPFINLNGNAYPDCYFADHEMDETVPAGVICIGGKSTENKDYATLTLPLAGIGKTYTVTMDMNVESLMQPAKSPSYRGLVFEITSPDAPLLYFTLNGMKKDAAGNNATIHLSTKSRAGDDIVQKIKVPADGKMHTWTVDFDGEGGVVFRIDGKEIMKAEGITAQPRNLKPTLQIKNVMLDVEAGYNSVYVDRITVSSQMEASSADTAEKAGEPGVKTVVASRGGALTLPVSDADWEKASPAGARPHGKTAEVTYTYSPEKKQLTLYVTYDLNSWLKDLSLVDGAGKEVAFLTDRTYGLAKAGNTLWGFSYADNAHADAVKTITFVIDNVTELPEKYVLFANNCGSRDEYTVRITMEFPTPEA